MTALPPPAPDESEHLLAASILTLVWLGVVAFAVGIAHKANHPSCDFLGFCGAKWDPTADLLLVLICGIAATVVVVAWDRRN